MNSTGAVYKTSNIMKITNRQILIVFLIQILFAVIGSSIGSTWLMANSEDTSYLKFNTEYKWNSNWGLVFVQ
jgi:hypothetical protein